MKGWSSFVKGVVTGVVCTVIWGIIGAVVFLRSCAGSSSQIESRLDSPDRRHVAVTYVDMGGGAAGWCKVYVDVSDPQSPFDIQKSIAGYKYEFSASCSSRTSVEWLSNDSLLISYSVGSGVHLEQKNVSDDHSVRLLYRIRD